MSHFGKLMCNGLRMFTILAVATEPLLGQSMPHYHIVKRIEFDSGSADFLAIDTAGRRLYGIGTKVIDIDHDSLVGELPTFTGLGFALAPELTRGLGRRGVLFDLKSLAFIRRINVRGDGSAYDPVSHRAFMLDDTTTVVDMVTGDIVGRIRLGDLTESGIGDGLGRIYVNVTNALDSADTREEALVVVLNSERLSIDARWHLQGCYRPAGMAINRTDSLLFVACVQKILVIDMRDGRVLAAVAIPGHPDQLAFDSRAKILFAPAGRGTMTLIREESPTRFINAGVVYTAEGEKSVAVDERTHKVFLYHFVRGGAGSHLRVIILSPV
jgi:hypothetical protein